VNRTEFCQKLLNQCAADVKFIKWTFGIFNVTKNSNQLKTLVTLQPRFKRLWFLVVGSSQVKCLYASSCQPCSVKGEHFVIHQ
jgi:hypothetical protein